MLDAYAKRLEEIKNMIPEIPDVELNIKFNGWDEFSNKLASIGNSMVTLRKQNEKYDAIQAHTAKALAAENAKTVKDTKEITRLETAQANTKLNQDQAQLEMYGQLSGAIGGLFEKGSKEAAAFQIVQQGLAMVNAVNAVAIASASSPWTGLATGAAMVAFLALLTLSVKILTCSTVLSSL